MSKIGLYIHIPFCKSKCAYCAFTSFRCDDATMHAYVDALVREISMTLTKDDIIDTLYIGGGTPSILHEEDIVRIIDAVKRNATFMPIEVTIECNPDSLSEAKLIAYKNAGVSRISMGVQSLNDDILRTIGRVHTSDVAIEKAKMALSYGMNTSVDMILGLPNSTNEDIRHYIDTFSNIGVHHISSYSLSVEKGTRLEKMIENGSVVLPSEDETVDQYEYAYRLLEERGYHRYEVSNFARSGYESKHNNKYWEMAEYIGLGIASHSFYKGKRYYNTNDIHEYIEKIGRGEHARVIDEVLSQQDILEETVMLGLRLEKGVDISRLDNIIGNRFLERYAKGLAKVKNCVSIVDNRLAIRPEYMNVMNTIIVDILY